MTAPLTENAQLDGNAQPQAPIEQEMTISLREQVIVITDATGEIVVATVVAASTDE